MAVGFGLFSAVRSALTGLALTGQRFAPGDLSFRLIDVLVVAIGIALAGAVSAQSAVRRARTSPLGVTWRLTPPAPSVPPGAPGRGIAEHVYFAVFRHPQSTPGGR